MIYRGLQVGIQVYRSTESLQKVYRYHNHKMQKHSKQTVKDKHVNHVNVVHFVAQPSVFSDLLHLVHTCLAGVPS